jgi:hypothetical protein
MRRGGPAPHATRARGRYTAARDRAASPVPKWESSFAKATEDVSGLGSARPGYYRVFRLVNRALVLGPERRGVVAGARGRALFGALSDLRTLSSMLRGAFPVDRNLTKPVGLIRTIESYPSTSARFRHRASLAEISPYDMPARCAGSLSTRAIVISSPTSGRTMWTRCASSSGRP